jgi:hypothetical protein
MTAQKACHALPYMFLSKSSTKDYRLQQAQERKVALVFEGNRWIFQAGEDLGEKMTDDRKKSRKKY